MDSGSEEGVIYFSFGSCIQSADLPAEKLYAFIETFRLLKQKVLWKFENETIPNMPSNVMIRKWLPQNDVLAHKNIVMFLTHGGIFGTQEGVHRGVPMIFIPVYSDQFRNAKRCVDSGYAEMLNFNDVSVPNLLEKMNTVLNDKKYKKRVLEISRQFRDNIVEPMDESMYWIEYVARHKGAEMFKSNATNIPWYIYLHLDILAALLVSLYIVFSVIKCSIKTILRSFNSEYSVKEKSS